MGIDRDLRDLRRGSLHFASEGWWARQDSNLQPDRYERRDNARLR
jgi:hypothetical protein